MDSTWCIFLMTVFFLYVFFLFFFSLFVYSFTCYFRSSGSILRNYKFSNFLSFSFQNEICFISPFSFSLLRFAFHRVVTLLHWMRLMDNPFESFWNRKKNNLSFFPRWWRKMKDCEPLNLGDVVHLCCFGILLLSNSIKDKISYKQ